MNETGRILPSSDLYKAAYSGPEIDELTFSFQSII